MKRSTKKPPRKLMLNGETIAKLSASELARIGIASGGSGDWCITHPYQRCEETLTHMRP